MLTKNQIEEIKRLFAEGLNPNQIAKHVGCDRKTVRSYLDEPPAVVTKPKKHDQEISDLEDAIQKTKLEKQKIKLEQELEDLQGNKLDIREEIKEINRNIQDLYQRLHAMEQSFYIDGDVLRAAIRDEIAKSRR